MDLSATVYLELWHPGEHTTAFYLTKIKVKALNFELRVLWVSTICYINPFFNALLHPFLAHYGKIRQKKPVIPLPFLLTVNQLLRQTPNECKFEMNSENEYCWHSE